MRPVLRCQMVGSQYWSITYLVGSAAGVAVMGMEKLEFGWYLRKISWLALLGYLAGAGVYLGLVALVR